MRKINYLLIIFIIFLSFLTILSELNESIVVILKDSSIVLTILLPYILNKIFKINMDESLIFVWIIFIFMAHYLGVICNIYNVFEPFDKIVHTFSGVLSACVAILIINKVKCNSLPFNILFILSFSWLCAGIWEVFEFTCNYFFGGDAQNVITTGVSDTMWDMIVAFAGSIIVSTYYYLKRS